MALYGVSVPPFADGQSPSPSQNAVDDEEDRQLLNEAASQRVWEDGAGAPSASADGVVDGMRDMSITSDGMRDVVGAAMTNQDERPHARQQQAAPAAVAQGSERQPPPCVLPLQPQCRRTYDDARDTGPALDPVAFPPPHYYPARRADVVGYDESTGRHFEATDVLFRVEGGQNSGDGLSRVERAYWRMPGKANVETRMGHLEKCHVLTRLPTSDDSSDDENVGNDNDDDDDDVVFLLTDECVAVKVNYCERMQRLCGHPSSHAGENPLVEIAALQLVGTDHPNVLGCLEALFDGEFLSVVMPYCDGGDLHDAVVHHAHSENVDTVCGLPESEARTSFRQFLEGLRHLQARGLCHRDLSPENLILDADDRALIIDMGMCLRVPFSSSVAGGGEAEDAAAAQGIGAGMHRRLMKPQGQVGKLPYMSPEVYLNRDGFDGFAIDMWTAGTILFFLLTGTTYGQPFDAVFNAMTQDLSRLLSHWRMDLSPDAVDLIRGLIMVDPSRRLTLEEALDHRWLRS